MSTPKTKKQGCLFEHDFLLRTLGPISNSPEVALTELVANAWDAGASRVDITLPSDCGEVLSISDDGTGMSEAGFREKWMKLGYDRIKRQGSFAEFPPERIHSTRPAYGRNGVGRHGMLCFAPEYSVLTFRDGKATQFEIATTSGENPFEIVNFERTAKVGHGTTLSATVIRNLPSEQRTTDILAARFLHDPQFEVWVNGRFVPLAEHRGLVSRKVLAFGEGLEAEAFFVDSTSSSKNTQYQGVAFWVGGRLVGEPGWAIGGTIFLDGRTRIAKRYTVVVKSDALFDDIQPDWSGFKRTPRVKSLLSAVSDYVQEVFLQLSQERVQDATESVFREHKSKLQTLGPLAKLDIQEFVSTVTTANPTIPQESLSAAVEAAIYLEKMRGGSQLLEKLAKLSDEDVLGLDRLLSEWTVRDALIVLDEIERRMAVCEAINKFSADSKADELHSLHPLVVESRWLFGPEFDSPEFVSNVSLNRALRDLFRKKLIGGEIENPRKRADILALSDRSISGTATEHIDETSGFPVMSHVLLIELKRGAAEIDRENVHQATDYTEDLLKSGLIDGSPMFKVYVIGHSVSSKIELTRKVGDRATVHVITYGQLVRLANKRLFRLKERLSERYVDVSAAALLDRILLEPEQLILNGTVK
jgi:hypothetical protein